MMGGRRHDVIFSVAVEAPGHIEFAHLFQPHHFLDLSVAFLALFFCHAHVLGMVEIGVIWVVEDLHPFNGFALGNGGLDFLNFWGIGFHLGVAIHAELGRRYACVAALLGAEVAVLTVHLQIACMELVAKSDGLVWCISFGVPHGPQFCGQGGGKNAKKDEDEKKRKLVEHAVSNRLLTVQSGSK